MVIEIFLLNIDDLEHYSYLFLMVNLMFIVENTTYCFFSKKKRVDD